MRKPVVLITGAGGEIGHGLLNRLRATDSRVITLDLNVLDAASAAGVVREFTGSVTDTHVLDRILAEFEVHCIFHLAALLSTRAEFTPSAAHHVNVDGTLNLLEFAQRQGESHGRPVTFVYPSSIATYGLPNLEAKTRVGRVREEEYPHPVTMYGCTKLYCEELGRYFSGHYKQLSVDVTPRVDFRALRFPGLISATTVPSGGTSDFAPEMIHRVAEGQPYECFVRSDTTLPFMTMADAVAALEAVAASPRSRLTRTTYNVGAFSRSAADIQAVVEAAFPDARITYKLDPKRQAIVDSWPADVDDSAARSDWGFRPAYDFDRAFREYLIPTIRTAYRS
jgi:nucleoside-diphosphate-sugar epimerase